MEINQLISIHFCCQSKRPKNCRIKQLVVVIFSKLTEKWWWWCSTQTV